MAVRTRERSVRVPTSQPTSAAAVAPRATDHVVAVVPFGDEPREQRHQRTDRERHERRQRHLEGVGSPVGVDAEFFACVHVEGDVGIGHDAFGDLGCLLGVEASISEDRRSSRVSASGFSASERRSISSSRSMSSFCARTLTHSPAAIEIAPANRPDTPARRTSEPSVEAPAMPRIRATLETSPSLTPKTAARAFPPWTSRWWWTIWRPSC